MTLVSISYLTETGYCTVFDGSICQIFDAECSLVGQVEVSNGLYEVKSTYLATVGAAREDRRSVWRTCMLVCLILRLGQSVRCWQQE